MNDKLKVIIGHDWINGMRGGERVLQAILELFPKAIIYTLFYEKNSSSKIIENHKIETHWINSIPFIRKNYRYFLPLFPFFMETWKIKEPCDLLITTSHCLIKGLHGNNTAPHVSYIHSPMRYIYDQFDSYFRVGKPWYHPQNIVATLLRPILQTYDRITNNKVDVFIANSSFVQKRILNYYNLESQVIHPFVDLEDFPLVPQSKEDYFIIISAMAPNKRIDLAINAFLQLKPKGLKLKIIGDGQLLDHFLPILEKKQAHNIEFLGSLPRKELIQYLAKAQALIFPGTEDFGITPLEALASFTPVIAYHAAGVLETLNSKVAVFFYQDTVESLVQAIIDFPQYSFIPQTLKQRAMDFSKQNFQKKIMEVIQQLK